MATYILGNDNLLADHFSRLFTLCQLVIVKQGISEVVPMLVNLENRFILTFKNSKLPMFCSLKFHRQAESTDALSLSWKGRYVYAFPPHLILNRVLKKVEQEEVTMILIALTWTRREWYPLLLDLSHRGTFETSRGQGLSFSAVPHSVSSQPSQITIGGLDDQRNKLIATGL